MFLWSRVKKRRLFLSFLTSSTVLPYGFRVGCNCGVDLEGASEALQSLLCNAPRKQCFTRDILPRFIWVIITFLGMSTATERSGKNETMNIKTLPWNVMKTDWQFKFLVFVLFFLLGYSCFIKFLVLNVFIYQKRKCMNQAFILILKKNISKEKSRKKET